MKRNYLVGGAVGLVATVMAVGLMMPKSEEVNNDTKEVVTQNAAVNVESTGNTAVLSAGVTYYLDKLSDQDTNYDKVTGEVAYTTAGATSIMESYGAYLSIDSTASVEDLDIATQFIPDGSIIFGYENLGISNVTEYLNVRSGPGIENKIVGKMPGNCACEIIGEENGWYKIKSGEVEGYVCADYILTGYDANVKAMETMTTELYVNCDILNVRQEPSVECNVATSVAMGEYLEIIEELDGWYKVDINNLQGYVYAEYVDVVNKLPTAVKIVEVVANTTYNSNNGSGSGSSGINFTYTNLDPTVSQTAVDLINYGMQFLGNPYVYGGNSLTSGTDCSGFVKLIFAEFGYDLPRSSSAYLSTGYTIIPVSEAKPGDIFLYNYGGVIGHVGIYVGNGQLMHASTPSQGIKVGSAFYTQPYCALRVIP